jgi:hypothetical protein
MTRFAQDPFDRAQGRLFAALRMTQELDEETRNRYRLRFREAVRDPSAKRAFARFGQDDGLPVLAVRGAEPNPLTPFPVKEGGTEKIFFLLLLREG